MSAYALTDNIAKSYAELRALRLEMGYSMAEMAALMGVGKAAYQGYETGRRGMPAGFVNRAREWRQIDLDFFAGMDDRIDRQLALEGFEGGIPGVAEGC